MGLENQEVIGVEASGALAVSDAINHCVGVEPLLINNAGGHKHLVLIADKGSFRLRLGDRVSSGMPATVDPAADVSNGSGALKIPEGQSIVIPAPTNCTVRGYAATDVLTYYFI